MVYWVRKIVAMFQTAFYRSLSVFFLLTLTGCTNQKSNKLPYYNDASFTPIFVTDITNVDNVITHKIADFTFKNQHNNNISEKEISLELTFLLK